MSERTSFWDRVKIGTFLVLVLGVPLVLTVRHEMRTMVIHSGDRDYRVCVGDVRWDKGCIDFQSGGERVHLCDFTYREE